MQILGGSPETSVRSGWLHPFSGTNVWHLLLTRAAVSPHEPYLIWHPFVGEGRTWSYDDFARDAAAVAAGLSRRGVQSGDRILVHLENCPEFLITWFACAAVGAVPVTTNTRSAEDELAYFAADSAPVGAVTQPRFAGAVARAASGADWLVCIDHDSGVPASPPVGEPFSSLRADPNALVARPPNPLAPMNIQYTSGTTSRPKGVVWTHANVLWGARTNARFQALRPTDRHLVYPPLFHTGGLMFCALPTMWVGASLVLTPKWSTSRFWDIARRHEISWLLLLGPAYRTLTNSLDTVPKNHSFRMFGGPCDHPIDEVYGTKTVGWFAMTETIGAAISGDPFLPNRPMSMGRPSPGYEIAVVRYDGTPVEPEETGHLLIKGTRGLSLFAEYLNNPQATADSFDELGWFRTGDLVTLHADGFLSFADRAKDMLKVGGENVAASEVERVALSVPGVLEAAVVGRPDDWLSEVPVIFVKTHRPDTQLPTRVIDACRRMLADFKVPRAVYPVRDLPRSTIGKVNKVALREVLASDADLVSAEQRWLAEAKLDPSGDAA